MVKTDIEEKLKTYINKEFFKGDPEALTPETPLLTSGILDSISALQMVDYIEETFEIQFDAHDVDQENLNSINSLTTFIIEKLNNK